VDPGVGDFADCGVACCVNIGSRCNAGTPGCPAACNDYNCISYMGVRQCFGG
jgi:hypothetical protein